MIPQSPHGWSTTRAGVLQSPPGRRAIPTERGELAPDGRGISDPSPPTKPAIMSAPRADDRHRTPCPRYRAARDQTAHRTRSNLHPGLNPPSRIILVPNRFHRRRPSRTAPTPIGQPGNRAPVPARQPEPTGSHPPEPTPRHAHSDPDSPLRRHHHEHRPTPPHHRIACPQSTDLAAANTVSCQHRQPTTPAQILSPIRSRLAALPAAPPAAAAPAPRALITTQKPAPGTHRRAPEPEPTPSAPAALTGEAVNARRAVSAARSAALSASSFEPHLPTH